VAWEPAIHRSAVNDPDPVSAAMVLAAGFGTRLRPLTEERPKPAVPVGDRTILGHIAATLARGGIARLVVNCHHLPEVLRRSVREDPLSLPVVVVDEKERILGTAGGVANARAALGPGAVLVHNGDILADLDVRRLLADHDPAASATLAVAAWQPAGAGTVGVDERGRVVRLRGRTFGREHRSADFIGVQIVSAELRRRLPPRGCLVGDVYLPELAGGALVQTSPAAAGWSDLGTIRAYWEANLSWLAAHHPGGFSGAGAAVGADVVVVDSVVGAGARVGGAGRLSRVVAWPGAPVQAPLSDAVVLTSGRVVPVPAA